MTCVAWPAMADPRRSGLLAPLILACAALGANVAAATEAGSAAAPNAQAAPVAPRPPRVVRAARTADGIHAILSRSARGRFGVHLGPPDKLERLAIHSAVIDSSGILVNTHEAGPIHFPFPFRREAVVIRGTAGFLSSRPSIALPHAVDSSVVKSLGLEEKFLYDEDVEAEAPVKP